LEGEFRELPPTPSLLLSLIWRESLRNSLQLPLSTKRESSGNRRRDQIKKEYRNYAGD
jgi:hypothetical protein